MIDFVWFPWVKDCIACGGSAILPHLFHLISLILKMFRLNLFIWDTTCAHFTVSCMVLTFHCPIFSHAFGENSFIGGLGVIRCLSQRSDRAGWFVRVLISVSVARNLLRDGVASPTPNPQLGGPGFFLGVFLTSNSGYLEAPDTRLSPLCL